MRERIQFLHLTAYVRECWVLASNRRQSAEWPDWTTEPTLHTLVIETVEVEEEFRRQGEFRAFVEMLLADPRFDMVAVEGVGNPALAAALRRWGWECDEGVMDFYKVRQR